MGEASRTAPVLTDIALVREVERIAIKVQSTNITDLELALMMAHLPNVLSEYRQLRDGPATKAQPAHDVALPEDGTVQPYLQLVASEEAGA